MRDVPDEFLSEEDLDTKNMSGKELDEWLDQWLKLAQISNDQDKYSYSHGVFMLMEEPHEM